jgi:hypothetical protein
MTFTRRAIASVRKVSKISTQLNNSHKEQKYIIN